MLAVVVAAARWLVGGGDGVVEERMACRAFPRVSPRLRVVEGIPNAGSCCGGRCSRPDSIFALEAAATTASEWLPPTPRDSEEEDERSSCNGMLPKRALGRDKLGGTPNPGR